jgi:hypothetical protein
MIKLLTAVAQAYVAYVGLKQRRYIDEIEDEIDRLARDGSASAKLRIERLSKRLNREQQRIV